MICGGVLVPDGTGGHRRTCFVEERGLGRRDEFRPFRGEYEPLSPSTDHFTPKSHGGTDDPSNLHVVHYLDQLVQGGLLSTGGMAAMTPEERAATGRKGGRVGGARVRDLGLGIFAMTPEEKAARSRNGGRVAGARARDGRYGIFAMGPAAASRKANHVQHHVNRGRINPDCAHCTGEQT
jgi:hypothetical protein